MEIIPILRDNLSKEKIESVQKQEKEFKLIGRMRKKAGHTLFSFNTKTLEVKRADLEDCIAIGKDGKTHCSCKTVIEKDCIYLQSLNEKNFRKKLKKCGLL